MANIEEILESDCCGNGCANCVLNIPIISSKKAEKAGKLNILNNYTYFRLLSKTLHSPQENNVLELHFKSTEATHKDFILDINAGYHLMMRVLHSEQTFDTDGPGRDGQQKGEIEKKRKYLLRPYSPYWWDVEEMEFKILVNLKQGPMSNYINELHLGDEIEFRGPIGSFVYQNDTEGESILLIITQGVAISPAIPIIENILYNDEDLTRVIHLACFKDIQSIFFRDKFYEFQKYWNYKFHLYLTHELCDDDRCIKNKSCLETCNTFRKKLKYKEAAHPFRLSERQLENVVETFKNQTQRVRIVLAGNEKFQKFFKDILLNKCNDFLENNIYFL